MCIRDRSLIVKSQQEKIELVTRLEFNSHARQDLRCFDGVRGGHVLASGEILNHPMSNSYVEKTFGFVSKDAEHFHNSSVALKVDCRDNFHHRCVSEECSQASLCQWQGILVQKVNDL